MGNFAPLLMVPRWVILLISLVVFQPLCSAVSFASDTQLLIHNRSHYPMVFAFWEDGADCSKKTDLPESFNINAPQPQTLNVPTDKQIALGVAVLEIHDKLPLACDYILSFKLSPATTYTLEYDVHDRRCYGQMYQLKNGTYQMLVSGGKEELTERMPVFGWDKFEPGCEEQ